jgi:hypothetical protein
MKTYYEGNHQEIEWAGRWEYILCSGEEVIGKLNLERTTGTRALAESEDKRWEFEKKWFPFEKVILRAVGSDSELAVFKSKWIEEKSSLEFADGHVFYWMPTNIWRNKCVFTDAFGEVLVHFKRNSNPLTALALSKGESRGRAEIERIAFYIRELPLLILLGCYLMILDGI